MKFENTVAKISHLRPNFIHKQINIPMNLYYAKQAETFGYYNVPVITEDNIILTHFEDFLAAKQNGLSEMPVARAIGLDEDDRLRFICFGLFFKYRHYAERFLIIQVLEKHFKENKKGIIWSKEIPGDINEKIATVVNFHKGND